jgi:predicted secreted protein
MGTRKAKGKERAPGASAGKPAGIWLDRAMLAMALAVAVVVALLYLL